MEMKRDWSWLIVQHKARWYGKRGVIVVLVSL